VAKLLEAKADVNKACNASGLTALLIAANGRAEVVAILLNDKNLDVNKANINGVTPLYIASQNGRDELVAQLRYSRGLFSGSVVSRRLNSLVEAYKVDDCY
jgi:ankyrin repeat protein